jgi:dinuclear metal center YbgI/SA1388 family protein
MKRNELENYLNEYLNIKNYTDYGPNGLQVEGSEDIKKIAFSVSATKASVQRTVESGADALIVHHGLFWKFHGVRTLTGPFAARVSPLIRNNVNLLGYHLPLDAHEEVGNAQAIANILEMKDLAPFGNHKGAPTGRRGQLPKSIKVKELAKILETVLDHKVLLSTPNPDQVVDTLGIITGGANGDWTHCLESETECYLTGEMSEHDWHEAQEAGIHMMAGGHHATEKFGIQLLQKHIEQKFSIETVYLDSKNPA